MSEAPSPGESRIDLAFLRVYDELRSLARQVRGNGVPVRREHHTTSLVHEAYLRLSNNDSLELRGEDHCLRLAARAMRHVLVDGVRRRMAEKRGAGRQPLRLSEVALEIAGSAGVEADTVALSDALARLAKLDARKADIVELRFFGGATIEQVAGVLAVSQTTVVREWNLARSWLYHELNPR